MASAAGGRMYVVETDRKKEKGIDRIMISENLKKYATEKFEGRRGDACYRRKIETVQ